jgi:porin
MGGPASVRGQIEEDEKIREAMERLPAFRDALEPWFAWKREIKDKHGLELSFDYSALYQSASASLTEEDDAASGVVRAYGRWTAVGRGTENFGVLVFKVENRHRLGTELAPSDLGFEVGYRGMTGSLYSGVGTVLSDLNWQHRFNGSRTGFIVGRYDPNDYLDVLAYSNPWTTFSNAAVLFNTSIALPDASAGIGFHHWPSDQWSFGFTINDANGTLSEVGFFDDGWEFYTSGEILWTPGREDRYTKNVHVTLWHVDEREEAGMPQSHGVAFGANWFFNERWLPFFRAGWSEGGAPMMNAAVTAGLIRKFPTTEDLIGFGINWGDPSDNTLREQLSGELFFRFQLSQNLALTPSAQLLIDPANNPDEDQIWVLGLRVRLAL